MGVLVIVALLVMVVRWRMLHRSRRATELAAAQANRQPQNEWSARFPADRTRRRRGRGRRWGF